LARSTGKPPAKMMSDEISPVICHACVRRRPVAEGLRPKGGCRYGAFIQVSPPISVELPGYRSRDKPAGGPCGGQDCPATLTTPNPGPAAFLELCGAIYHDPIIISLSATEAYFNGYRRLANPHQDRVGSVTGTIRNGLSLLPAHAEAVSLSSGIAPVRANGPQHKFSAP
jgi:hypothetical protein